MGRFVDLDLGDEVIRVAALRKIMEEGIKRHQAGVILEGPEETKDQSIWQNIEKDGKLVGHMTHKAWFYRLKQMIGYALVSDDAKAGDAGHRPHQGPSVRRAI